MYRKTPRKPLDLPSRQQLDGSRPGARHIVNPAGTKLAKLAADGRATCLNGKPVNA